MRTTDFPASRGCAGDGQHEGRPLHDRLRERYSPLRAAYIARVLTADELSVVCDPDDALVIARIKRMPSRRLARFERMEPASADDRRLYGSLQLRWLRTEEYLLATRLGRPPTHGELWADFMRHHNGPRFRAYFALKCPHRVRPIRRVRPETPGTHPRA
jgi:hypothetical protein